MFRWVPYAMVRIAFMFISGILLGIYQSTLLPLLSAQILLVLLVAGYLIFYWLVPKRKRSPVIGMIGLMAILIAGYVHLITFADWNKEGHLSTFHNEVKAYVASIDGYPEEKENSWKYKIAIHRLTDGKSWQRVEATALIYIRKESNQPTFFYGDKILIRGHPQLLAPPQNPYEFDFKRFLSFKNIYHQQFVKEDQAQFLALMKDKDLKYYSFKARKWASEQLAKQLPNKKEQAIAKALTLGVTDGIDNELQSAYAASGAMHILAVSGLHVGILYGIVLLLFKPIRSLSWSRWVIAIISLLVLWSFAFVTGLSPSVLRAVTMFSFIAVAKPFGRSTSIYNTLASSAFLLLIFDPFLIMSVGFQLSYLAVFGIVTIHRPLYRLLEPRSRAIDWIWSISCVSFAAQLATFSLGILYFHQFPVYFLFSNLFVIPGAISVLVTSLLVITFSVFTPLSSIFGAILESLIQILNYVVFTFEKFPFSLIGDIYITTFQCWLLILTASLFLLFLHSKKMEAFIVAFVAILVFSLSQWQHYVTEFNNEHLVVYNISGHHGIEWVSNGHSKFFTDSTLNGNTERMRFHIRPNRLFYGVGEVEVYFINDNVKVFAINSKIIGLVNRPVQSWPKDFKLDYLIIGNNSFKSLADIRNTINFEKLILDSSNSPYLADRIRGEGNGNVYSVLHEGAFVEKF